MGVRTRAGHCVVVVVYDGVRLLDVTGPLEVFTVANEHGATYGRVITSAGVTSGIDLALGLVETGMTPARYVELVRVETARGLLEARNDPLDVVARRAGFGSPETMRRAFVREIGVPPAAYRSRFRTTRA